MSISTLIHILGAVAIGAGATFVFVLGHKLGVRSCRSDYDDGRAAGQKAERDWWEHATLITRDALADLQARDRAPDLEGGWQEPPPTDVLMAEAVAQGYTERVPSVAEVDQMAAEWHAAHGHGEFTRELADDFRAWSQRMVPEPGPPIVANVTDAGHWRPFEDDIPTVTGVIVPPQPRDRTGPEWLQAQLAAMDSETDAYLRRMKADAASFRRGITTGIAS